MIFNSGPSFMSAEINDLSRKKFNTDENKEIILLPSYFGRLGEQFLPSSLDRIHQ